jgi:uncharacterized membrane protein YkoI
MKKFAISLILGTAMAASLPVFASNDVGPDKVVQLVQSGAIKPFDELNKLALSKHANSHIHETELEQRGDIYVYSVELRDDTGTQWEVDMNAATGEILRDRRDR